MKKDSLLPQVTYLELNFTANRIGYIGTSPTDPRAGNLPLTGAVAFTGMVLKLAVQMNEDLKTGMKQKIGKEGGLTIPIPWTTIHLLSGTVSSQAVFPIALNRGTHGHKIQRIIYAPLYSNAPADANLHRIYDHNNDNGAVISQYYTELDNVKIQRDSLNVGADVHDDYMAHKQLLKNTTYYNQDIYNKFWVHIDSLNYPESNHNADGAIYTDGLTLVKPTIWSFAKTNGLGNTIYHMGIIQGQKLLRINATAMFVE